MSGGVVEFRLRDGASIFFRADGIAALAEPDEAGRGPRLWVHGDEEAFNLHDDHSWMESVRLWRLALGGSDLATARRAVDQLTERLREVEAERDALASQVDALDEAGDEAEAAVQEAAIAALAPGEYPPGVYTRTENGQWVPHAVGGSDREAFLEAEVERLREELAGRKESCARAVDRAEAAERDAARLRSELAGVQEQYAVARTALDAWQEGLPPEELQ